MQRQYFIGIIMLVSAGVAVWIFGTEGNNIIALAAALVATISFAILWRTDN